MRSDDMRSIYSVCRDCAMDTKRSFAVKIL